LRLLPKFLPPLPPRDLGAFLLGLFGFPAIIFSFVVFVRPSPQLVNPPCHESRKRMFLVFRRLATLNVAQVQEIHHVLLPIHEEFTAIFSNNYHQLTKTAIAHLHYRV